ncbi:MAG: sulfotransferase [Gammaproteobacteria bacterium]
MGYHKYLVLGNGRTGTTLLHTLLNSHPQIVSHGEVLHLLVRHKNKLYGDLQALIHHPIGYFNENIYGDFPDRIKAVGFKLIYKQIGGQSVFLHKMDVRDAGEGIKASRENFSRYMERHFNLNEVRSRFDELVDWLRKDSEIKVIHLKRKNKLHTVLSEKLACRSGIWNSLNAGDAYAPQPIDLDYDECLNSFREIDAWEKKGDRLFQHHETMEIFYEDLIKNTEFISMEIQGFLGVDYQALYSPLKKLNNSDASKIISNFSSLAAHFKNTEWIDFFEN